MTMSELCYAGQQKIGVSAALALFVLLAAGEIGFAQQGQPNILFIEVDDLHPDYLGCAGNQTVSTPSIDNLAKQGVLFRNAVCQGTMCGPSRNSLITGTYPHNLGFYKNGQCGDLPKDLWAFPAALQRSGYHTSWIGKSHVHASDDGITGNTKYEVKNAALARAMGFDNVFSSVGRALLQSKRRKPTDDSYLNAIYELGYFDQFYADKGEHSTLPHDVYMDGYFASRAIEHITKYRAQPDQEKPFFLWLNLSLPHGPLDVADSYHTPYASSKFHEVLPAGDQSDLPPELVASKYKPNKDVLDNQRQFGACVTFIDDLVKHIVETLEQHEIRDETMIVFFSDHGIMMADHGLHGKGTLFKETLNPSLIVSLPGAQRNGIVETRPVELMDILKTCLEVAAATPEEMDQPYGESLGPLLTGKGKYERKSAFGEMTGFYAVVTAHYKYINNFDYQENETGPVLFDLKNDPGESRNVATEHQDLVRAMQATADQWLLETAPVRPPYYYSKRKP
jgi:arylsulfatase A-like enzyme